MKCFNHDTSDAVAVCKNCGKALCHECASDIGNGIACLNSCERQVSALNELIARNKSAAKKISSAHYKNAAVFGLLAAVLVYIAFDAYRTDRTPLLILSAGTALVFLLAAFFNYSTGHKFAKGGN